jgi:hypothetical protein
MDQMPCKYDTSRIADVITLLRTIRTFQYVVQNYG